MRRNACLFREYCYITVTRCAVYYVRFNDPIIPLKMPHHTVGEKCYNLVIQGHGILSDIVEP